MVDLKLVMGLKRFDVFGLTEMFLQKDEAVSMAEYVWYSRTREGDGRASGGVGVLVNRSLELRLSSAQKGVGVGGLRGEGRRKLMMEWFM